MGINLKSIKKKVSKAASGVGSKVKQEEKKAKNALGKWGKKVKK